MLRTPSTLAMLVFFAIFAEPTVAWQPPQGVERHADATDTAELQGYELSFPSMGTVMSLQAFASDAKLLEPVFKKARDEADRISAILTDYDPDSETVQLSASNKIGTPSSVSDDLWTVLVAADHWNKTSNGKFDASIGALTSLWRQARRAKRIPDDKEIAAALAKSGWQHIALDHASKTCTIEREGIKLDFGAVAKGYIVDRVFQVVYDAGFHQCMVRAGGDIHCGDAPPGRKGWRIMVGPIAGEADALKFVTLRNEAIATSGDLWQYIEINGVRRSHIIDAATGIGIDGPISASVIAPTSMQADAAATTCCLLGHQLGGQLAEELPHFEAMIVSQGMNPTGGLRYTTTSGFSR
jgi:FAD:protein FMN transferase